MGDWIEKLEAQIRKGLKGGKGGYDEDDEGDREDDEDGDMDDEPSMPAKRGRMKGTLKADKYAPADNGDDDEDQPVKVYAPETLEETSSGRKLKREPAFPTSPKQMTKSVHTEVDPHTAEVIEASDVLQGLTKAIDRLAGQNDGTMAALYRRVAGLEKALEVIGRATLLGSQQNTQMLKSLAGDVDRIAQQPAGRKAAVRTMDKSFAANETAAHPPKTVVMKKAIEACQKGLITNYHVSKLERDMNLGGFDDLIWAKINGVETD